MTTATAPTPTTDRTDEVEIAEFLAQDSVEALAHGGYLAGHDGNLIVRQLRRPQLRKALEHSICYTARPDPDAFYRKFNEDRSDWHRRRAQSIRDQCALCPFRAACAELALREEDAHGVHGGLSEEKLAARLTSQKPRLEQARAADTQAVRAQADRLKAAADVQRIALMYLGSTAAETRAKNNDAVRAAVQRRDTLVAAHRLTSGWVEAA